MRIFSPFTCHLSFVQSFPEEFPKPHVFVCLFFVRKSWAGSFSWVHPNKPSKIPKLCINSAPRWNPSNCSISRLCSMSHTTDCFVGSIAGAQGAQRHGAVLAWEFFSWFSEKSPCKSQGKILQVEWSEWYKRLPTSEHIERKYSVLINHLATGVRLPRLNLGLMSTCLTAVTQNLLTSQTLPLLTWPNDRTAHSVVGG